MQKIYSVPLVRKEILGCINLHGGIILVLDIQKILNLESDLGLNLEIIKPSIESNFIVIEYQDEVFSFIVDEVEEVIDVMEEEI